MKHTYLFLCVALLTATCLVARSEARGGRGRGGGSFGGLFGGWRSKYGSKSSSSGNGRRVVNGSPAQASMPRLPPPPPPPPPAKSIPLSKQQAASYPRQQLPPGYGYAPAPGQGMYYANAQTLPAGAVYYAQPPPSMLMGSGTGNFLGGMLAGHMMNSMLFGHRHHAPVYRSNPQGEPVTNGNGREVIIINNGQPTGEAETNQPNNESLQPQEPVQSSEDPLDIDDDESESSYSEEERQAAAPPELPAGGIVCFPIMLNETDPQNPELVQEVERVVCFPAPSQAPQTTNPLCQNDPQCILEQGGSTTSTVPPIVAGDIGAATEAPSLETSSIIVDADDGLE